MSSTIVPGPQIPVDAPSFADFMLSEEASDQGSGHQTHLQHTGGIYSSTCLIKDTNVFSYISGEKGGHYLVQLKVSKIFTWFYKYTLYQIFNHANVLLTGDSPPTYSDGDQNQLVEICHQEDGGSARHREGYGDLTDGGTDTTQIDAASGRSRGRKKSLSEIILDFFFKYYVTPAHDVVRTTQWINSATLRFIDTESRPFKLAVSLYERKVCNLDVQELYNLLKLGQPIFGVINGSLDERYESREDSYTKLLQFIKFQFDTAEACEQFRSDFFHFLNRTSKKKNAVFIRGVPSSGKTYFARVVREAMLISGQVVNMNCRSQFPLNNCTNKRILYWDEPSCDPSSTDQLKTMFSGDDTSANLKYRDHGTIRRTPVLITGNKDFLPNDEAFRVRIFKYKFKQCPMLINWKYLHPMCLYDFFLAGGLIK